MLLKEAVQAARKFEVKDQNAPLSLRDIELGLKWQAYGIGLGAGYKDYKDIPIDRNHAEKLFQGYVLIIDSGLVDGMEYVKED